MRELWSRIRHGDARCLPLEHALGKGHVAVADWLVDEPVQGIIPWWELDNQQEVEREDLWKAQEGSSLGRQRGRPALADTPGGAFVPRAMSAATRGGHLRAARFLHEVCGVGLEDDDLLEAAGSRSIPTAQWLQAGCAMGPEAYGKAARVDSVAGAGCRMPLVAGYRSS